MAFSLFLNMSPDYHYNATLRSYDSLTRYANDLELPAEPHNAVRETNRETLRRLSHDLTSIANEEHKALDIYRLYLHGDSNTLSTWGYCLEAAHVNTTDEVLILFRNDEDEGMKRTLCWLPLSVLCTKRQAQSYYQVSHTGPSEEGMHEVLQIFRDVFEQATATKWSYEKRLEFYYSFPLDELKTAEDVMAYRAALFNCPTFRNFDYTFPECN